jgi:ribonuclease-3 family protein
MLNINELSPLTLAFLGDAVYTLAVREYFVKEKKYNINRLNSLSIEYLSAVGQANTLKKISDVLTDTEKEYVRKGRNASKATVAKHASPEQYRLATGFECMIGYLSYTGQNERIQYLTDLILKK